MSTPDVLVSQARERRDAGDAAGALDLYRRAAAAAGEPALRAHCLRHVGDIAGDCAAAMDALDQAETLYRGCVVDALGLANTVRLRALLSEDASTWREARALYASAAAEGWDLTAALAECDRHLG